jgi:hypothetical protein
MVRAAVNENSSQKKSVSKVTTKLCKNETHIPSSSSAASSASDKVNILFFNNFKSKICFYVFIE